MIECPECGALEFVGSGGCTRCGASLVKMHRPIIAPQPTPQPISKVDITLPPRPVEVAPAPVAKAEPQIAPKVAPAPEKVSPGLAGVVGPSKTTPHPQGRINGRGSVNGTYRGNINGTRVGAANGASMINGRGAVNGTGLVNGTGMTNGASISLKPRVETRQRLRTAVRWKLMAALVAVVILIPAVMFVMNSNDGTSAIDGNFEDWTKAQKFGMRIVAPLPEIAVYEWAVKTSGTSLSVFVRVQGAIMGSTMVDSFYLFVDKDNDDATGYYVSGIGADYLLAIDGWDGVVQSGALMEYAIDGDGHDWNSWMRVSSLVWATKSGMLEAMAGLGEPLVGDAKFLLLSQNNVQNSVYSVSYPVPKSGGVLIIRQEPGSSVSVAGTIPKGSSESLASLSVKCEGEKGTIASIAPIVTGASLKTPIRDIALVPGQQQTLDLLVDTSGSAETNPVSLILTEFDVTSTFDQVVIEGDGISAYVSSPPPIVKIDGAFGDWIGRTGPDSDASPVPNPNVNITAVGAANSTSRACFFVSVQGGMYEGTYAPSMKGKPTAMGGGGSVEEKRQSGEDLMRIYVDSDSSNATGLLLSRTGKTIGADYLIEIAGVDGQITSQGLSMYSSGEWILESAPISVEKDSQRIELSVASSSIGGSTSFSCVIETTDWRSRGDWAWAGTSPDPWVVDAYGNAYQTSDGRTWSYLGAPTLQPGDRVVDIALSISGAMVFLVTDTGRTYYWDIATSTNWTAGQTIPIDVANYSEAVSMAFYSNHNPSAWLLTKSGAYFWLMDVTASKKPWTYQDTAGSGFNDFTDLVYSGGTMYALRTTANTGLLFSLNGNTFVSTTSPTGSTSPHTEFTYIPGGPGASDDRIFVLCQNGNIRYSSDGGSTWSALGNLPTPTGSNASKYVGMGIDSTGYMWVVTDTGYCFRSTDTTNYNTFTYTGRTPISGIVAVVPLPALIPEFPYLFAPVLISILVVGLLRRWSGRRDGL